MLRKIQDDAKVKWYKCEKHHFWFDKVSGFSVRDGLTIPDGKIAAPAIFVPGLNSKFMSIYNRMLDATGIEREPDPFWSPEGPELLDICITERCNRNCPYCYQDAKKEGRDMPIELYCDILKQSQATVAQIALGGGEVVLHPNFAEILQRTREEFGMAPNYTTNGDWIIPGDPMGGDYSNGADIMEVTKRYCGAVAVSSHGDQKGKYGWEAKAIAMAKAGVKTNIHFILSEATIDEAVNLISTNDLDSCINAIVFLLFKPVGRGEQKDVLVSYGKIRTFLDAISETKLTIGFDACSVPMLISMTALDAVSFDSCEGSRFSGYVHVDGEVKACSFDKAKGVNIKDKPFIDIWKEDLQYFRDMLGTCHCDCAKKSDCWGGCPIAPEIVICDLDCRK